MSDMAKDLANAIRLTVEYVGNDVLPAQEGWSWFDALDRYYPEMAQRFVEKPIHFPTLPVDIVVEPILFRNDGQNPQTLSEVIGVGAGAISACWDNLSGAGVFESTRAKGIVDEMMSWIQANYVPMSTYHDSLPEDSD